MTTFDEIIPELTRVFTDHADSVATLNPVVVNRDVNGRVRLILRSTLADSEEARQQLGTLCAAVAERLGPHAYPADRLVLFEDDPFHAVAGLPTIRLGETGAVVVDRLAAEGNWATISEPSSGAPRVVFFSVKGGVGRSTALAVTAWVLAEAGQRVLVVDLDLESPGLSSSLLPEDHRPAYGVTDWLVEDLVSNGAQVLGGMCALSPLSRDGEIYVVPAHGSDPGEYVSKLGRVWMPSVSMDGRREAWSQRLARLLDALEVAVRPDVILIDSRAGIDEIASACVTDIGAHLVLMFALNGEQTWTGYDILLRHWNQMGVIRDIRDRLQLVGALVPETDREEYIGSMQERAATLFATYVYDEVRPDDLRVDLFNFEPSEMSAPHAPLPIRWNSGFSALSSLHDRLSTLSMEPVRGVYGPYLDAVLLATRKPDHL